MRPFTPRALQDFARIATVSAQPNTINQALRRMGYAGVMTAHGFRSMASSLLNEDGRFSPDVIEHALAHRDQNAVRAIYNRTSYWNARVEVMQAWSDMLDALRSGAPATAEAA